MVFSFSIFPVFNVLSGSKSIIDTSSFAIGLCSTPFGTMINSFSFISTQSTHSLLACTKEELSYSQAIIGSVLDHLLTHGVGRSITIVETSTPVALGVTLVEKLTEGPRHCLLK